MRRSIPTLLQVGAGKKWLDSPVHRNTFSERLIPPGPNKRWVRLAAIALLLASGGYVHALLNRRGRAEKLLRESEERRRAIAYIEDLDVGEEPEHKLLYVSPQIEAVLGYSPEEWLADPDLWKRRLHPEDVEWVLEAERRTGRTGGPSGDNRQRRSRLPGGRAPRTHA